MLRDDVLLRAIERLAAALGAYLRGDAARTEVEQALQAMTGMPLAALDLLPPDAVVPPIDDPLLRARRAVAIADALEALDRPAAAARLRAWAERLATG